MTMQDATLLIGRLLLVVLYVVRGLGKWGDLSRMKNLGLAGGLLILAGMGAGRFALMRPSSRLSA
ncbi:hypothetical protein [Bosea lathyri]|uniref:Uncharacterized protein n=1 Tax=Bosea lathyri TaxID=1036778 RepID=A0A1H5W7W4_9HYPH|nr:hypothetical protein [Bosea lathyri]SEF95493.1 hypothetical protein SAMN04488115_102587 [Bosea lathyri]